MVTAAAAVAAVGTVAGLVSALDAHRGDDGTARPTVSPVPSLAPLPAVPSRTPTADPPSLSRSSATPEPGPTKPTATRPAPVTRMPAPVGLYRYGGSQVLDWVRAHPSDPRRPLIESRIAARPAAVWFADFAPDTLASRVRAVTSGAARAGRVPVVVAYAIPQRDCGGASDGGAPDIGAYDDWIDRFAAGLGTREVIVILEPDALSQTDCLSGSQRADRYAALARAGRVMKTANPRARVYYDAGHSDWNPAGTQAARLRAAGAAAPASSDGVFTNVSNFNRTDDEIAYARRMLTAMGAPDSLGAVIDTSRNGNGAAPGGAWCDPDGRGIGQPPTLTTGRPRIDAYLWVKLPGESDGCKGEPGTFVPGYAYELAKG
ncbi:MULTISPECIES: glycoside hydrolase family 6 protein [unclassified Streptomyces]|uniref:glycoside hydrolase family 6 protein n=1 Tax=unclassified Streptomyces TaxID=2593676 RepID=UPI000DBA629B|nr:MULTISPECIES: glycoside hydrolase family 6 protein [unclassified Streptomyces]MYT69287.1 endoglucanase [Streptomyces sp. SID8367]RAJ79673.1 endoglucanase [Streptomyces sp. PsTaAH-137]